VFPEDDNLGSNRLAGTYPKLGFAEGEIPARRGRRPQSTGGALEPESADEQVAAEAAEEVDVERQLIGRQLAKKEGNP
jgi:hypothetical protein